MARTARAQANTLITDAVRNTKPAKYFSPRTPKTTPTTRSAIARRKVLMACLPRRRNKETSPGRAPIACAVDGSACRATAEASVTAESSYMRVSPMRAHELMIRVQELEAKVHTSIQTIDYISKRCNEHAN